jgi:A/G-specific adenine glycosylase
MATYPTPAALAAAAPADVLRAWRGLGYNRRAIALQRAAGMIVAEHGSRVPSDVATLQHLPGIGPYSARAVAALAFGRRVGAVDTNVRRVLGRAFFDGPPTEAALQTLADQLAPRAKPGLWTHALMDIGATLCRIRNPHCGACPLAVSCRYVASGRDGGAPLPGGQRATAPTPRATFRASSRWLRGRILDRLRDASDDAWLTFRGPIGEHDADAVGTALRAMASDGLLELRGVTPPEARLPLA